MTVKQQLLERVQRFSEAEAAEILQVIDARGLRAEDDWGDLEAQMDAGMRETLGQMADEEDAAGCAPWDPRTDS